MAGQTILIVEDDPDIRDGVRILLAVQAYRFCAPQSCGHSNGEYVGWSPNRVTPLNMGL